MRPLVITSHYLLYMQINTLITRTNAHKVLNVFMHKKRKNLI